MKVFIEARPTSYLPSARVSGYVVVTQADVALFSSFSEISAVNWARSQGFDVYVARARHRVSKRTLDHWRKV